MNKAVLLGFGLVLVAQLGWAAAEVHQWQDIVWRYKSGDVKEATKPDFDDSEWGRCGVHEKFRAKEFAWVRTRVTVPEHIGRQAVAGKPIALRFNAGGGEIFVDGKLYCRYDNDHPAAILLAEKAKPGKQFSIAARLFLGPDNRMQDQAVEIGECEWKLLDVAQVRRALSLRVDCGATHGPLNQKFSGLSQGAGMADYNADTAAIFKDIGIKWMRMDNVLTNALKKDASGEFVYDWTDLDKRTDFIRSIGAEPIYDLSYMPEVLDATHSPDRHSRPRDWSQWEELCYQAVKHCVDRGTPVKYWEVWNESNAGWITLMPGEELLPTYLDMYDHCAQAVKRADPNALIGGPCNAAGPWDKDSDGKPGTRGELMLRGLLQHCSDTGVPLDFITWHEYFHPSAVLKRECDRTHEILAEYPAVAQKIKEIMVTEWNFAWWHDWPQDHEMGAAWCADGMIRGWMAGKVDRPCFFYAKDFSEGLHGDWGMLTHSNQPKAVANVCRMFNRLAPDALALEGTDKEVTGLASVDPQTGRVTVLLVNFPNSYGIKRTLDLNLYNLPAALRGGTWRRWLVDKDHSNIFNNPDRAQLESVETQPLPASGPCRISFPLEWNGVTMVELLPAEKK